MKKRKLYLSKTGVIGVAIYYSLIFFATLVMLLIQFMNSELEYESVYIIASLSGLLSSSIFYIRKLYKDCFKDDKISLKTNFLKQAATIIYFATRPFFAVAFSILIVLGVKSGFIIISSMPENLNSDNFIYTCSFLSFISGFKTGAIITKIESTEIKQKYD